MPLVRNFSLITGPSPLCSRYLPGPAVPPKSDTTAAGGATNRGIKRWYVPGLSPDPRRHDVEYVDDVDIHLRELMDTSPSLKFVETCSVTTARSVHCAQICCPSMSRTQRNARARIGVRLAELCQRARRNRTKRSERERTHVVAAGGGRCLIGEGDRVFDLRQTVPLAVRSAHVH